MEKRHYHVLTPSRPLCPICKKATYSRGGIHPQCAKIQAEPPMPKKPGSPTSGGSVGADVAGVGPVNDVRAASAPAPFLVSSE